MWQWLWVAAGYLLGSISSAVVVSKLWGLPDPRTTGSRNPGATNVLRVGGKRAAAITLLGDVVKGWLPVVLAQWSGAEGLVLAMTGLAAFLGHLYPLFFGFQGGKGVATAFGVMTGLHWGVGLLLVATWLTVAAVTRISSLSALVAAVLAPFYVYWLVKDWITVVLVTVMAVLLIWRHRGNIQRIIRGEEDRIGER